MPSEPPYIYFNPRLIDREYGPAPAIHYVLLACGDPSVPGGACYRYGSHSYSDYQAAQEAAEALTAVYRPLWGGGADARFIAIDEANAELLIARQRSS